MGRPDYAELKGGGNWIAGDIPWYSIRFEAKRNYGALWNISKAGGADLSMAARGPMGLPHDTWLTLEEKGL